MDILVLKNYYASKKVSRKETETALKALKSFTDYLEKQNKSIESCTVPEMKQYLSLITDRKKNTKEVLLALARSAYLANNKSVYIYFTQIIERDSIIANLRTNFEKTLGVEKSDSIFNSLIAPEPGAPPEKAYTYTRKLVETLKKSVSEKECRKALTANAHGIPAEAFQKEKNYFENSKDLKSYLEGFHKRSVKTLQEHADSGKVWFEQVITQPVVDYVKNNREVMGGVLEEGKILWTKIPYDTEAWLEEKDSVKRRYFACHCPMAREILKHPEEKIPRAWCNCTSGYIQQRFNAIFGQEIQVDLLETVLDNQDRCRFAIHVPEQFL